MTHHDLGRILSEVAEILNNRFADPIQVDLLAQSTGLRAASFYEAFKQRFAVTPHQYLTQRRIDQSMRLLARTSIPMAQIAQAVGYDDEFYFSRVFKREAGLAPTHFRRLVGRRILVVGPSLYGQVRSLAGHGSHIQLLKADRPRSITQAQVVPLSEHDLRAVRSFAPDLIVCASTAMTDGLTDIAPTLSVIWYEADWKQQLRDMGGFLGMGPVAAAWLKRYEARASIVRATMKHGVSGDSVLVVHLGPHGLQVFGGRARKLGQVLYGELEVSAPKALRDRTAVTITDFRELDDFGADRIICLTNGSDNSPRLDRLQWQKLKAAKRGAVHFFQHEHSFEYSARCHDWLLEAANTEFTPH